MFPPSLTLLAGNLTLKDKVRGVPQGILWDQPLGPVEANGDRRQYVRYHR